MPAMKKLVLFPGTTARASVFRHAGSAPATANWTKTVPAAEGGMLYKATSGLAVGVTTACDPVSRDIVPPEKFQALCREAGISNDTTVVLYGDLNNWFACWGYWIFTMYGHKDVKLMNGGRKKWELDKRPLEMGELHAVEEFMNDRMPQPGRVQVVFDPQTRG